jgi:prepilin-type processing-associated H-X9-DG protein
LIKGGASPDVIHNLIDDSSYIYTGYAAYSGDYGTFVTDAESQFLGFVRAIDELGWKDFDSDITVPEESPDQYGKHTIRNSRAIYRLREGIGKLLVTDASDPALVRRAESECAVVWDRLPWWLPPEFLRECAPRANVLYLDGHVEFLKLPGKFPMTQGVAEALGNLEYAAQGNVGPNILWPYGERGRLPLPPPPLPLR